jgi:hypothetical protein
MQQFVISGKKGSGFNVGYNNAGQLVFMALCDENNSPVAARIRNNLPWHQQALQAYCAKYGFTATQVIEATQP